MSGQREVSGVGFQVSGKVDAIAYPEHLYETTFVGLKVKGFIMNIFKIPGLG